LVREQWGSPFGLRSALPRGTAGPKPGSQNNYNLAEMQRIRIGHPKSVHRVRKYFERS